MALLPCDKALVLSATFIRFEDGKHPVVLIVTELDQEIGVAEFVHDSKPPLGMICAKPALTANRTEINNSSVFFMCFN